VTCQNRSSGHCHNVAANRAAGTSVTDDARCAACPFYNGPARGLGDVMHAVARATGVAAVVHAVAPDCGCAERRKSLNERFPAQAP
jgi:hypothetical protein